MLHRRGSFLFSCQLVHHGWIFSAEPVKFGCLVKSRKPSIQLMWTQEHYKKTKGLCNLYKLYLHLVYFVYRTRITLDILYYMACKFSISLHCMNNRSYCNHFGTVYAHVFNTQGSSVDCICIAGNVTGNDNCLFNSISLLFWGSEAKAGWLRLGAVVWGVLPNDQLIWPPTASCSLTRMPLYPAIC